MPLIRAATLLHLAKSPLGVLGNQRLGISGGALERRDRCGVADVAQRYADISQHAPALGPLHRRAAKLGQETVVIQREQLDQVCWAKGLVWTQRWAMFLM